LAFKKPNLLQLISTGEIHEARLLDLGSPELRLCHPSTLIYGDLTSEALCEARVIQLTVSLTLHPDALFLPGSQICSSGHINTA
jgi:hypothetical protein